MVFIDGAANPEMIMVKQYSRVKPDAVVFTMSAPRSLMYLEKKWMEDCLLLFGEEKLWITLTRADCLDPRERGLLLEHVRTFFVKQFTDLGLDGCEKWCDEHIILLDAYNAYQFRTGKNMALEDGMSIETLETRIFPQLGAGR